MDKLNEKSVHLLLKSIDTVEYQQERNNNIKRFSMYNGRILEIIKEAILKEFKKPETANELIERIIPINIPLKITNKLANVYNEAPSRKVLDENENDQELMDGLTSVMQLNARMKEANRYFKLYKASLSEIVISEKGAPKLRNLPRHTYKVFSHSASCPDVPDTFMKYMNFAKDPDEKRFIWWTDEQHFITDGSGKFMLDEMNAMGNPEGINPYGVAPFVYINSSTFSVDPIPDDDLLRMGIVIPLLLTDMAFAIKYLSWGVIFAIGAGAGDFAYSPNSIIHLDYGPEGQEPKIGSIRPELDVDGFLRYLETLVAILLSTKNLSSSTIQNQLNASNAASGVAKALDSAESLEDKKDQQAFFFRAEKEFWEKIAFNIMPVWRKNGQLNEAVNGEFSRTFEPSIAFREPKVLFSEEESIKVSRMLLSETDGGALSTVKGQLSRLHPEFRDKEIDALAAAIEEDRGKRLGEQVIKLEAIKGADGSEKTEV